MNTRHEKSRRGGEQNLNCICGAEHLPARRLKLFVIRTGVLCNWGRVFVEGYGWIILVYMDYSEALKSTEETPPTFIRHQVPEPLSYPREGPSPAS